MKSFEEWLDHLERTQNKINHNFQEVSYEFYRLGLDSPQSYQDWLNNCYNTKLGKKLIDHCINKK